MSHICHAFGCNVAVPPAMFSCKRHWYMLPKPIRDAVWREYRPGQEDDKAPSVRYCAVQRYAVATLAEKEGKHVEATEFFTLSNEWRRRAVVEGKGDPLFGIAPALGVAT